MKKLILTTLAATGFVAGALTAAPAHAAPRQIVVVVAEGLSPQVLSLGQGYLRKADDDAELTTAFDSLLENGKSTAPSAVADLKGLLETAETSGYKTGLVTTARVTDVAPLFYDLGANPAEALTSPAAKYDFIAGGGRAAFAAPATEKFAAAGNTYISNQEGIDTAIKGKALALQAEGDLSYALDRNPEQEAGLTELTTLALDTLGSNDAPFVLVVHDTLAKKALDSKDSPALFEQFRELNSVVSDINSRVEDNKQLAAAFLWTGSAATPRFSTTVNSEIGNGYFILSNLGLSYAGVGAALKGATSEKISAFIDPEDGQYKGWKLSNADRAKIIAGTLSAETAVRASYEPAVKLGFDGAAGAAGASVVGIAPGANFAAAVKAAVSAPPAAHVIGG